MSDIWSMRDSYLALSAVPADKWPTLHPNAVASLYTALPDGSNLHRLTTQEDHSERNPVWSPDGSMLVYETEHTRVHAQMAAIYRVALDGSLPEYLAEGAFPRWMPDGRSILYIAGRNEPWTWAVVDSLTLENRSLFTEMDLEDIVTHAAVSPDGALFAVTLDADYGFRLLTDAGRIVEECALSSRYVETPVWASGGQYIAFSAADDEEGTEHSIHVLTTATGDVRRISGRAYGGPFVWAPDGEQLAIADYAGPHVGLYIVSRDGSERRRLFDLNVGDAGEGYIPTPTWSPDGQYLAVKMLTSTGWDIIVHDISTNTLAHRLAWVPAPFLDISDPVWRP